MRNITVNLLDYFWKTGIKPIKNRIEELKEVAFSGKYSDLTDRPSALKNPNALTFTGAVTESYDGSANKSVKIPSVTNNLLATQQGTALDAVQGKALDDKISQIYSKLATAWADATTTDNVVDGAVQWHQWGLMCEIIVAVSISTPEAWKELKIATNLPPSRFGIGARGIIQSQETGLAYCIKVTSNGELFVRTDAHPQSGWYRGAITYITTG